MKAIRLPERYYTLNHHGPFVAKILDLREWIWKGRKENLALGAVGGILKS